MNLPKTALLIGASLLVTSCGSRPGAETAVGPETGLTPFPLPSSNFRVGQVVEIYSRPPKVTMTLDPEIPDTAFRSSASVSVSEQTQSTAKANLEASVTKVAAATAAASRIRSATVSLTNTSVTQLDQFKIATALSKKLKEPDAMRFVTGKLRSGIRLSVIEALYQADVKIEFKDDRGVTVDVDTETIKALKADLGLNLSKSSNGTITGTGVALGYQWSPDLLKLAMDMAKEGN